MLRALRQRAQLALEEQGVQILCLTFGLVQWTARAGEAVDSHLLVLPVTLDRPNVFADLSFNPALATRIGQDFGVDLSEANP